ncbi:hypothetical protein J0S82_001254 [Galemys pyrenaicus]|uniref:Uncharacterized protein n=1 Tax=Galemys pyrenaicus TaxID=202257 RepID=A0A8J5ZZ01_GALPY|nr:hypothetical protein J0S82_001254 [Galemys pyrenaicus]
MNFSLGSSLKMVRPYLRSTRTEIILATGTHCSWRHGLVPLPSSVCVTNTQEVLLWQGRRGVLRVVVKKDRRSRCPGSSEDRARPRRFAEGLTIRSGP